MRLSIQKSKNEIFYYVLDSWREGSKVMTKRIFTIGKESELKQKYDDVLSYAKDVVKTMNEQSKQKKISFTTTLDLNEKLEGDSKETKATSKNIGYLCIREMLSKLSTKEFCDLIKGNQKYDMQELLSLLVSNRILFPSSKKQCLELAENMYGSKKFSLNEVYRFIKVLSQNSDSLQAFYFKKANEKFSLDTDVLYYDCTNFYFESDEDVDMADSDGDIIQYGLRKYGYSKEHRPKPIVQMGLFTDSEGIPISFCINPGNTNEQVTAIPLEQKMINNYKLSKFIYSSDGGLNSAAIRFVNSLHGRNYVVSQSLKKIENEDLKAILMDLNWKFVENDEPITLSEIKQIINRYIEGQELTEKEQNIIEKDMIYKKYPMTQKVDLADINENVTKNQKIKFEETLFVTFSIKYFLYEEGILSKQILRAEKLVLKGKTLKKSNPNDISRLIEEKNYTENGEIASNSKLNLNDEQINKEKELHGFYATATNLKKSIKDVMEINKNRWRIELNFKIMKSYLNARPAFMSSYDGIRGHFTLCYLALLVYKLFEKEINMDRIESLPINSIIDTLKNMNVAIDQDNKILVSQYTNSETLKEIEKKFSFGLDYKVYSIKDFTKKFHL